MTSRPLSPSQIARRDQALASARDTAAKPGHIVNVFERVPAGLRCGLCDCATPGEDPASPHADPAYQCGGCQQPAEQVVIAAYGTPWQIGAPVCARHIGRARQIIDRAFLRASPDGQIVTAAESGWGDPA